MKWDNTLALAEKTFYRAANTAKRALKDIKAAVEEL